MKFNIIIANPPYQHNTRSIYQNFIEKALEYSPEYINMIVKNNWINSSLLEDTRRLMIKSGLSHIVNYPTIGELFDDIGVAVSIFVIDKENLCGKCNIKEVVNGEIVSDYNAQLTESSVICMNKIENSIYNKIKKDAKMKNFSTTSLPCEPFRITSRMCVGYGDNARELDTSDIKTDYYNIALAYISNESRSLDYKYINHMNLQARLDLINHYKLICGGRFNNNKQVVTNLHIIPDKAICTGSYSVLYTHPNKEYVENAYTYIKTRFVRFLILMMCDNGMTNMHQQRLKLIPVQDFNYSWSDRALYEKYSLTQEEIDYIENKVGEYSKD